MPRGVIGTVKSSDQVGKIMDGLRARGFASDDVSVLFPETQHLAEAAELEPAKTNEGIALGAGAGGVVGVGIGWMVGIGLLALPGIGILVAASPLLAAMSGGAVGAAVGGAAGALVGMGVPEDDSEHYESHFHAGRVLVAVKVAESDRLEAVESIFADAGAENVKVIR